MRLIDADALIDGIKDNLYGRSDTWCKPLADALIKCIDAQDTIDIPEKDKLKNDYACLGTVIDMMFPYNECEERTVIEMRVDDVQRAIIQALKDLENIISL